MSPHKAMQSGDLILDLGSNGQDFWEVLAAAEVDAGRGGARQSLAGGLVHDQLSSHCCCDVVQTALRPDCPYCWI